MSQLKEPDADQYLKNLASKREVSGYVVFNYEGRKTQNSRGL
jgi:hypothetical protein